jgi:hypothetical protein
MSAVTCFCVALLIEVDAVLNIVLYSAVTKAFSINVANALFFVEYATAMACGSGNTAVLLYIHTGNSPKRGTHYSEPTRGSWGTDRHLHNLQLEVMSEPTWM